MTKFHKTAIPILQESFFPSEEVSGHVGQSQVAKNGGYPLGAEGCLGPTANQKLKLSVLQLQELCAANNHVSGETDSKAFPDPKTVLGFCMEQCRGARQLLSPGEIFSQ